MFRQMRRTDRLLPESEAERILESQQSGTLAVNGDDGYPYAVPVSHVYHDRKIYFHSADTGHKLDSIKRDQKVSFCVVEKEETVPEAFRLLYRSTIVFGKARILTDDKERQDALELILKKFSPDYIESGLKYIKAQWENVCVFEIEAEHMTGKESK